ncbi:HAD-IIB family hydrolase [Candidatus Woesearchaeota archaeon]|nr:HAD-IIB family hydrolase [Candidatus Woesearchaeota archaeon]
MEITARELSNHDYLATKKIIFADVDETICETCQVIEDEMAEVISSLIKKGYIFAFISGTEPHYLKEMISSKIKGKHFLLPGTGTICIDMSGTEKELYRFSLTAEERKEVLLALQKLTEHYNIHSMTTKEDQIQDRKTQIALSAIGRHAPTELKKQYDPDGEKRKVWIKYLKKILDETKYEITIAGTSTIDITRKGLDKGWGIKQFSDHQGIDLTSIIFFGDKTYPGGNDYPATKIVDYVTVKSPRETLEKLRAINLIN